jgi:hypothetical protein
MTENGCILGFWGNFWLYFWVGSDLALLLALPQNSVMYKTQIPLRCPERDSLLNDHQCGFSF